MGKREVYGDSSGASAEMTGWTLAEEFREPGLGFNLFVSVSA